MKKIIASILLVPSLAFAQPGDYGAPLPVYLPGPPIIVQPGGGYVILYPEPERPSRTRKIAGGVTLAAGVGLALLGGLLLANRPQVPALGAPGWFDAQTTHDGETAGGLMLIGTGVITAIAGGLLLAAPDNPCGAVTF